MKVTLWRIYAHTPRPAGAAFFVERLWPRGISRAAFTGITWLKEVAPSAELRRWYAHRLERWPEFTARYRAELDASPSAWRPLLEAAQSDEGCVLVYAARDEEHNSAVVLREVILGQGLG